MFTDFCGLDCAWRGLWVNIFISTLILGVMAVGVKTLARKLSHRQMKWYLNSQYLGLAVVLVGNFIWIAWADPELASRCFAQFAKLTQSFTLTRLVAGGWLVVVMGLLLFDGARMLLVLKRNRHFDCNLKDKWRQLNESVATRMGLKTSPRIVFDQRSTGPHVVGLVHHQIVLPQKLGSESEEMVKNILSHEMAHVRDRDSLWMLAELFCRRLLFFHPLVYVLQLNYQVTIEKAADEMAVLANNLNPASFVETLCRVAEDFSLTSQNPAAVQVNATRGFQEVKQRLEALIYVQERRSVSARIFVLLAAVTLLVTGGLSVTHAGAVARREGSFTEVNMCSQLNQEKMIESWLRIERESNQCEK